MQEQLQVRLEVKIGFRGFRGEKKHPRNTTCDLLATLNMEKKFTSPIHLLLPNGLSYFVTKNLNVVIVSILAMPTDPATGSLLYEVNLDQATLTTYKRENGWDDRPMAEFLDDFIQALAKPTFSDSKIEFRHNDGFTGPETSMVLCTGTMPYALLLQRLAQGHGSRPVQPHKQTTATTTTTSSSSSSSSTTHIDATQSDASTTSSSQNQGGTKRSAVDGQNNAKKIKRGKLNNRGKKKPKRGLLIIAPTDEK